MKKILSAVLVILLLIPSAVLPATASDNSLSVFVATDLHMTPAEQYGSVTDHTKLKDNELYPHATMQGQMEAESEAIVKSMLSDFAKSNDKNLLICGDLCSGKISEHKAIAKLFSDFENRTGKSIFVVPGNHDVEKQSSDKASIDDFKEIYADFGYNEALSQEETSGSYTADLGGKYRLLAIDSCIYGESDGQITSNEYKWILEQVQLAKNDGKYLIAMMHHNLLQHVDLQTNTVHDKTGQISFFSSLAQEFADMGIKYFLTGHLHANDITQATSCKGNRVYDILTGSLTTSPNAYRELTFSDNGVQVQTHYVTNINVADLPSGYNEKQLALIQNDFPSYASGFFEAGMILWIERYLGGAGKIAQKLKISEDSVAYNELDRIMKIVGDSLKLPIYSSDSDKKSTSIQSIAASVGKDIPQSDYQYPYQVVAAVMSAFYSGNGKINSESTEMKLLYSILDGAFAYALGNLPFSGIDCLLSKLGIDYSLSGQSVTSAAQLTFRDTAAKKLAQIAIEPLLNSISNDAYSPDDLNVTLDAYGQSASYLQNQMPLNVILRLLKYLYSVLAYALNA
jgi:predicted MPP superfamily phosphohydrolase